MYKIKGNQTTEQKVQTTTIWTIENLRQYGYVNVRRKIVKGSSYADMETESNK